MSPKDLLKDLELLARSGHGLLVLETAEEQRVASILRHLADRLDVPLFQWSRTQGLKRDDFDRGVYGTTRPQAAFEHIAASDLAAVYQLHEVAHMLRDNPDLATLIKDGAVKRSREGGAIVLSGVDAELPATLDAHATPVSLPGPSTEEFRGLLGRIVRDVSKRQHVAVELSESETNRLLEHLGGLTLMEAEKILTKAMIEDGRLTLDDIHHVIEAKRSVIEEQGLLEYYPVEESLTEIADLVSLKAWLGKRKAILEEPEKAREFGLSFPRGVLLLGVPGCGKSLSAKAVATEWRLPLLKLDPSNLYNKYIGESEKNFKRAMVTAERMAPVILWVDEIEKAFATGGTEDGGVSQRILGTFLSWMQERRGDVFVVATANDIERLPPEFLRKGRFDEIFFVDLPDEETRREIFRIHLQNRDQEPGSFALDRLAEASAGFSGAEIEQVVLSGLYSAFSGRGGVTTELLLDEIRKTRPLSVTMAERVERLREWASDRAVQAN